MAAEDATQYTVEASGIKQKFRVNLAELKKTTTSAIEAELEGERKFTTTIRNQQSYLGKTSLFNFGKTFDLRLLQGEIAVFECQLTTTKLPVNWFIGDQQINSSTFSVLKYETRIQDLRSQLLVKNITERDFHKRFSVTVGNEARFNTCN